MHSVPNTLIETKSAIYSYPRHFYMAVTPWILNGFLYALEACLVNLELRLPLSALNFSSRNRAFQKPSKINKIEARKSKEEGRREIENKKSQDWWVTFKPKILLFAHARTSQANILHHLSGSEVFSFL